VTDFDANFAAGLARRFRLVRRLGEGGMGAVFLAEQIAVGNRPVALKVLSRKLLDDPDFLLRFQNEAASTGRIHHPNVVTIYESGQADEGTPYIAMEYLEGESLRQALARRGPLPVPEVAEILQQAARGLNAAHKLGIIHRDLKPDNIFLTYPDDAAAPLAGAHDAVPFARDVGAGLVPALPVGTADAERTQGPPLRPVAVKLVDFGIAKLRESGAHTQTGMVLGTPAYMSFEQASGMRSDELDARSDIYSLGVVVYEMLTGRTPFHSDTPVGYLRLHMQEAPPPFRAVKPDLPALPQLESVVMKALTKDRNQRYGSVLEFARAFAEAADARKAVVGAVREPPLRDHDTMLQPPPTARRAISVATGIGGTRSRPILWVGIPAAALLLVLGGWYVSSSMHLHRSSPIQSASVQTPQATVLQQEWDQAQPLGKLKLNPKDGLKYVWIPPGTFMMGCSPGDTECGDDEKPPHQVTITEGFWLGQTEVTVGAYKRFAAATGRQMPDTPGLNSRWTNENMPIVNVTWNDAHDYCAWAGGRLPTEAEWEYAARGGSTEARYGPIDEVAWYDGNSGGQMHDVAQKRPNGFGLYDILGNVCEWVNDWYDQNYYQSSPSQDPQGLASGQLHVLRGGSRADGPRYVRVSLRNGSVPAFRPDEGGFRCGGEVFAP
jgi:serine/threonine-protein kinase